MTSENQNFEIYAGDSKTIQVNVTDAVSAPVDLSGYSIAWKLAVTPYTTALISKSLGSGITCPSPATGIFYIALIGTDTINLAGLYYHEGNIKDGTNNETTVIVGRALVNKSLV